ncbi:MAG: peptidase MA family metallohydrolase [Chloroflexota bacterium]
MRLPRAPVVLSIALVLGMAVSGAAPVAAFNGFGATSADSTYGSEMVFRAQLPGGAPDKLELLLRFGGADSTFVARVDAGATSAEYRWDAADRQVTPSTPIAYRWRATEGGSVTLSAEKTLVYEDDRPGLNWQTARIGDAVVHWYGGSAAQARVFGEVTADAASAAEALLGHTLAGPIDIYVYDTRDQFFGALGPGAREWTGAATFPALRTVFMWLGGGSSSYLRLTVAHEVTHVVFQDATDNAFHEPAKWFNEGFAVWSEEQGADTEVANVRSEAGNGLLAFEGISESFPIGERGARLAYAQGASMVQMIIDTYGRDAIAAIAEAWRDGAGDAEALEAGTGVPVAQLYEDYFASFGVDPPTAVEPAPILPSNVDIPPQPATSVGEQPAESTEPTASQEPIDQPSTDSGIAPWLLAGVAIGILAVVVAVRWRRRRAADMGQ